MKAVLLVGGKGTRLRSVVASTPKPLASIGGQPFLRLLVRQLRDQGVRSLIMCTGYMADQIEDEFADGRDWDVDIEYSRESEPLGTAGAIRLAGNHLRDVDSFLVLNGDSFLQLDFNRLLGFHREHEGIVTLAAVEVEDASRYGTLLIDNNRRVTAFAEKTGRPGRAVVNAGVYVCDPAIFDYIPLGQSSLEKDVFPKLLGRGVYALAHKGIFIDIGTPEDYALAQQLFENKH